MIGSHIVARSLPLANYRSFLRLRLRVHCRQLVFEPLHLSPQSMVVQANLIRMLHCYCCRSLFIFEIEPQALQISPEPCSLIRSLQNMQSLSMVLLGSRCRKIPQFHARHRSG